MLLIFLFLLLIKFIIFFIIRALYAYDRLMNLYVYLIKRSLDEFLQRHPDYANYVVTSDIFINFRSTFKKDILNCLTKGNVSKAQEILINHLKHLCFGDTNNFRYYSSLYRSIISNWLSINYHLDYDLWFTSKLYPYLLFLKDYNHYITFIEYFINYSILFIIILFFIRWLIKEHYYNKPKR